MITKTPAFQTSDGQTYATLEIAQRAEMLKLLMSDSETALQEGNVNAVLHVLFKHIEEVREILSCTGRKPRKKNGATRKRKTAVLKPDKRGVVDLDKAGVSK